MENEIAKRTKEDKNFLKTIKKNIIKKIKPLEKIYKNPKALNFKKLIKFLRDFENCYSWMEVLWFICTIADIKKININLLIDIRNKTNDFAPNTEMVIKKSIKKCFPKYQNYWNVIFGEEIKKRKIPTFDELKKRKRGYMFTDNKLFLRESKKDIEKKYNIKIEKDFIQDISILKGEVAYSGKIRGKVKSVMDSQGVKKFKKGEILVSSMTMTDVMPAFKKAAAIITDEGGFLCHAAIIARELKKPCIIGTKIATKFLKDGDLVEVDADHGLVTVIKRK
jgi:phosphoenolpyruvate synthase/pyruvate phosphate dikinase